MSTPLQKRLQVLEARPPKVDTEHNRRFHVALSALFDAVSTRCNWERSTVAPFYRVEQPSDMALLWSRIKTGTTTAADQALLDGLPVCHLTPEKLVQCIAELRDRY